MKIQAPTKKNIGFFICGILWGIAITYIVSGILLKKFIILEYKSKLPLVETAEKIAKNAEASGNWIAKVSPCAIPQPDDGSQILVVTLCNAKIAKEIVDDPESRKLSSIIPCQFAVYQKADGSTAISRLNFLLIGSISGKTAAKMSAMASKEQKLFLNDIIE